MAKEKSGKFRDRVELLDCLWAHQSKHGYIKDNHVKQCAEDFGMSEVEIEGVISFYHFFKRQPGGKFTIYLNNSIVSEFKGFERIKEAFERETGASFGSVDPGRQFGLFETACIGLSDYEPAALINFHPFINLTTLKVKEIISQLKKGKKPADICDDIPNNIRLQPPKEGAIFFRDYKPGSIVPLLSQMKPQAVIEEVKRSKLRGMGGALFPTGLKWASCAAEKEKKKYIVCNADEGEPGTFKDRVLMTSMPALLLEGMIVASYAVGSNEGIIYLRAEYFWMKKQLEKAIKQFYKMGLLGSNISGLKGFNFDLRIQMGAGAYVCGEETALLNSMEGKRGEPRTKQFFPTEKGFLNKPTVVNNVETFCAAARVVELGSDHFLNIGTESSPGTKLLSVSGDCHKPGIYEVAWGTKVSQVLKEAEAENPSFVQVSGPSGSCISAKEFKRSIEKDDLPCGGSFMIFNDKRDILTIMKNYTNFFKEESCGFCTPCRAGNFIILRKLEKIGKGLAYPSDYDDIREWGEVMKMTSRCGLGKAATNSLNQALEKFPKYFDGLVDHHKEGLNKEFDLESAVQEYEKFKS